MTPDPIAHAVYATIETLEDETVSALIDMIVNARGSDVLTHAPSVQKHLAQIYQDGMEAGFDACGRDASDYPGCFDELPDPDA